MTLLVDVCFQNGESALHAASLFGHLKVVKELVQAGANVDLKNKVCSTCVRRTARVCDAVFSTVLLSQDRLCFVTRNTQIYNRDIPPSPHVLLMLCVSLDPSVS